MRYQTSSGICVDIVVKKPQSAIPDHQRTGIRRLALPPTGRLESRPSNLCYPQKDQRHVEPLSCELGRTHQADWAFDPVGSERPCIGFTECVQAPSFEKTVLYRRTCGPRGHLLLFRRTIPESLSRLLVWVGFPSFRRNTGYPRNQRAPSDYVISSWCCVVNCILSYRGYRASPVRPPPVRSHEVPG